MQNTKTKEYFLRASDVIAEFMVRSDQMGEQEFGESARSLKRKIDSYLDDSIFKCQLSWHNHSLDNTNSITIIAFLVFFIIGGCLFVAVLINIYATSVRSENLEKLMRSSMQDEPTGLFNNTYFNQRLMESMNRVGRFRSSCSPILFLRIEIPVTLDKNTHPVIIKELANRLRKSTRIYDVNARFSNDTFCSIIHEVGEKRLR